MDNKQGIIECVANISHGQADWILMDLIRSINNIQDQKLLHVDNNIAANRTVLTFAGHPEAVIEAAYAAISAAAKTIDMRSQKGAHPRIGATDVCPLVPLANITMEETIKYAQLLAERVGNELNIPIYLYEYAAKANHRRTLPQIRKGGYEGLFQKMKQAEWQPDYGPALNDTSISQISKTGATVIGARDILVAFNISLNTKEEQKAQYIASRIRSSGYMETNAKTQTKNRIPGLLSQLRAIGWYIDDFKTAQVSMNLLDFKITSPLQVWETVKQLALELGCQAVGCEVIGLIPESCILEAGLHALKAEPHQTDKKELIQAGIEYLGLDKIKPFDPEQKILEYALKNAGIVI